MKYNFKKLKKGFTIVELVIVIAVIAVLAAVLIPTFSNVIKKAQTSADIQACRQMNEYLAINEVTEEKTVIEVYEALKEGGMDAEDYKPLTADTYYFWDKTLNRILYTDNNYNVIYPEEYTDATKTNGWSSLSGEINQKSVTVTGGSVSVATADELYYVVKNASSATTVSLTQDIDMMGAELVFQPTASLTIYGGGKVLSNVTNIEAKGSKDENGKSFYSSGLVNTTPDGKTNETITIKDLTIKDSIIGDTETGSIGGVVAKVNSGDTVVFDNVHVINCDIKGNDKVGGFVGALCGNVEFKNNSTIEGTTVSCSEGLAGIVIGCQYGESTIKGVDQLAVTNSKTVLYENPTICSTINAARNYVTGTFKVTAKQTSVSNVLTDVTDNSSYANKYNKDTVFKATLGRLGDETEELYYVNYENAWINFFGTITIDTNASISNKEIARTTVVDQSTSKTYVLKKVAYPLFENFADTGIN